MITITSEHGTSKPLWLVVGVLLVFGAHHVDAREAAPVAVRSGDRTTVAGSGRTEGASSEAPVSVEDEQGSSPSNASNYGHDANFTVNPRTGELTADIELVDLPGISDESGLKVTLSFSSADAVSDYESNTRYFGLPFGWKYNISFVANKNTTNQIYIDGTQTYVLDPQFYTTVTFAGGPAQVATGLLQYNRADMNFRPDSCTVTVGGIPSAQTLANLAGTTRYFSAGGLLLEQLDRFGNALQYFYDANTNPGNALLTSIVDSWGHATTFTYCNGGGCEAGQVTLTMPDGRTVSFVAPDPYHISKVIDAAGLVTSLAWTGPPCERGQEVLVGMTSPAGNFTTVQYTCINVCTMPSNASCLNDGHVTTWPVVSRMTACPDNADGAPCPSGSATDYLTTTYSFSSQSNPNNYTGYPLYSPYQPTDATADALMSSNNTAFTYSTVVSQVHVNGTPAFQTTNTYNFLHLMTDSVTAVRVKQQNGSFGLSTTKETSYCYPLTAAKPASGCPTPSNVNYQSLPANYQSPIITGSCVYAVGDAGPPGQARVSVYTSEYDSFGETIHTSRYFGTGSSGVTSSCSRSVRLNPSPLQLVYDDYTSFDTPTGVDDPPYIDLGAGAVHFGVPLGRETFNYAEPQSEQGSAHRALATSSTPLLVQLTCNSLNEGGASVAQSTSGLLANSTSPPTSAGTISACESPSFDTSVAPPKTQTFTYDGNGRVLTRVLQWASGVTPPLGSISSTSDTYTYTLTATQGGEEACAADDGGVFQI